MSFGWIAAGTAVLGAASSVAGAKKQADASKKGADTQLQMFETLNKQQQPYIQSGYGALSKLNTLLGLSPNPNTKPGSSGGINLAPATGLTVNNGPNGPGVRLPPRLEQGPQTQQFGAPQGASNLPLRHILTMRAQNGDTEAARILQGVA